MENLFKRIVVQNLNSESIIIRGMSELYDFCELEGLNYKDTVYLLVVSGQVLTPDGFTWLSIDLEPLQEWHPDLVLEMKSYLK